jgi:transposase
VGNTKCGKGSKVVDIVDGHGTPLAIHVASASESEVNLIEPTLDQLQVPDLVP